MKKIFLLIIINYIIFFNSCGCEDGHKSIIAINNSNKILYVDWACHYSYLSGFPSNAYFDWFKILQNGGENHLLPGPHGTWESEWFNGRIDTLMIFFFDEEVLKNNSWETVKQEYLVLQRYDLSLQDLQKLNWKVYYPPTEAMKDIKMYPPYQEKEDED